MTRRAFVVWLVMMGAEVVHGVLRAILLVPLVGDFRARQAVGLREHQTIRLRPSPGVGQ